MSMLPVSTNPLGRYRCPSGVVSVAVQSSAVGLRVHRWSLDDVLVLPGEVGLRTVLTLNTISFTLCD